MRRFPRSVILGMVATVLSGASLMPTTADEPAQSNQSKTPPSPIAPVTRKGYDPVRRVPAHFGKVGLTAEQREQIYQVRAQHLDRIDRLRRELHDQQAKMMVDSEGVLTDVQKKLLDEHRRGAAKAREKAVEATAKVDPK